MLETNIIMYKIQMKILHIIDKRYLYVHLVHVNVLVHNVDLVIKHVAHSP